MAVVVVGAIGDDEGDDGGVAAVVVGILYE